MNLKDNSEAPDPDQTDGWSNGLTLSFIDTPLLLGQTV
jgi:hypothetical protein